MDHVEEVVKNRPHTFVEFISSHTYVVVLLLAVAMEDNTFSLYC